MHVSSSSASTQAGYDSTYQNFRGRVLVIEAPLGTNHDITAEIWAVVKSTLDILRDEDKMAEISKIRFVPGGADQLVILCYENGKPRYVVNLDKKETTKIPEGQILQAESTGLTPEDWLREQLEKAEKYHQYVANLKQDEQEYSGHGPD